MRSDRTGKYTEEDFNRDFNGELREDASDSFAGRSDRKKGRRKKSRGRSDKYYSSMSGEKKKKRDRREDFSFDEKPKKNGRKKKTVAIILAGVLILAGACFAIGYGYMMNKISKVAHVELDAKDLDIDPTVDEQLSDYRNIIILGVDARKGEDVNETRSDAIVLMSINKKTKEVKMSSVMRDSYLYIEEKDSTGSKIYKYDKITHAHVYGGPKNSIRALNRNLDLNIKEFIRVDWKSVADAIDSMGGVTINVKKYEIAELNKYIRDTNKSLKGSKKQITHAGKQTLNGVQAVTYCRIRKVGNGDEERGSRMRKVIEAAYKKAKTLKLSQLDGTLNKALPQVTTSISSNDIMGLMLHMASYKIDKSYGFPKKYAGAMIGGVSYVVPETLESNVSLLHKQLFGQSGYTPTKRVQEYSNQIVTQSGYGTGY